MDLGLSNVSSSSLLSSGHATKNEYEIPAIRNEPQIGAEDL
jgi:hypothetical protein